MKSSNSSDPNSTTFIPHSRPTLGDDEARAVAEVVKSGHIAQGEVVTRFESAFARKMGARDAVAVSSGTAALHLILLAMGVKPGDEVIIPSYVCTALLYAVEYVAAKPILAEIDPLTNNINAADVKRRVTKRTKAIIVPHMFGLAADLDQLLKLGVPIIEDCAQAVGGVHRNKPLGTFGQAAIFSFYATKVMTSGEGGMVITRSPELLDRVRDLKVYDEKPLDRIRFNYKMTDMQAAIGEVQLGRLDNFIARRRHIAQQYMDSFKSLKVKLPQKQVEHIYYRFTVGLDGDCEPLIQDLKQHGIGCARPVFLPIHRHLKSDGYPITDRVWKSTLSIPIYPSLPTSAVKKVISRFIRNFEKYGQRSATQ